MKPTFRVMAGLVLTATLAGCGESAPESGPVEFKGTNSPAIDSLREQMSKNVKTNGHPKKATETDSKAASEKTEAAKKP